MDTIKSSNLPVISNSKVNDKKFDEQLQKWIYDAGFFRTKTAIAEKLNNCYYQNLQSLDISNYGLDNFPTPIVFLRHLIFLELKNNRLKFFPKEMGQSKIAIINLKSNGLNLVDPIICTMNNLRILILSNNNLIHIPNEIKELKLLVALDLKNNKIRTLPIEIIELRELKGLDLCENPLTEQASRVIDLLPYGCRTFV